MATGPIAMETVEVIKVVSKNNNLNDWNAKITESNKFRIGFKDSVFSSIKSRNNYVRILINGFNTIPMFHDVSFEDLFNPVNGYANFQTLLNTVPVPSDHDGL